MKQKILPYFKLSAFLLTALLAVFIFINLFKLHLAAGGWDWIHSFLPATQALLSGRNPYDTVGFYNPPWLFLVTVPFALLPTTISALAVGLMNFAVMAWLAYRLKANPVLALLAVFSAPVIWGFLLSNIDWLILLGLLMPPQIGLFFVLIKPQVGLGIAIFWLYESWRKGKFLEVIKVFAPVSIAYLISFLVYGFYLGGSTDLNSRDWNTSFFPYSIVIGILLLLHGLRKPDSGTASASSPFYSPYVGLSSWSITVLGLIKHPWMFFTANGILWVYFIVSKILSR